MKLNSHRPAVDRLLLNSSALSSAANANHRLFQYNNPDSFEWFYYRNTGEDGEWFRTIEANNPS